MAAPRKIAVNMSATYIMNSTNLSIAGSNIFSSRIMSVLLEVGSEIGYFPCETWLLSQKCCAKLQSMSMTSYFLITMVFSSSSSLLRPSGGQCRFPLKVRSIMVQVVGTVYSSRDFRDKDPALDLEHLG